MVASPNAINGVYSPSASAEGVDAPAGSNAIEKLFVDFFKEHHGYSTPSEFNGRSDYGPFIVSRFLTHLDTLLLMRHIGSWYRKWWYFYWC